MSLFTEISEDMAREEVAENINPGGDFDAIRNNYLEALRNRALELQNDGNFDLNEADVRFSTALNLSRVRNSLVAIVGAGGLGNWQWRILVSMGFRRIAIYDDDNVGIENVGPQAHSIFDLGMPKVQAVENAALMYRGIKILARNCRVMSYSEICADLGENPDIVIGCTDSADFRNNFIDRLINTINTYGSDNQLPDLFIDYRMSLGDWVAYIIPAKAVKSFRFKSLFCNWYRGAAIFDASEAVQEPCTERAIAYTGANVASFTGSLLHWFYSGGRQKFYDEDYMQSFASGNTAMPGRKVSFSSRDFEFITDTAKEKKLAVKIAELRKESEAPWDFVRKGYGIPAYFHYYDSGDGLEDDFYDKYHGKLIVLLSLHTVALCGFDRLFSVSFGGGLVTITDNVYTSRMQPYVVYACDAADLREQTLLQLLSGEPGDIFRINATSNYVCVQRDYIEQILDYPDDPYNYKRVGWNDVKGRVFLHPLNGENVESINKLFDERTRELDARNEPFDSEAMSEGTEDDGDDSSQESGARPLEQNELEVGMTVTIGSTNAEPVTISEISASHFKVRGADGLTNYSLRRFPNVYLAPAL